MPALRGEVRRRAHEWQPLTAEGSADFTFFEDVKQWVKRGCEFRRRRKLNELSAEELTNEAAWLREELSRLEGCPLKHKKALTLQARLQRHHDEWRRGKLRRRSAATVGGKPLTQVREF